MMNILHEEETFKKLKRITFEEMEKRLKNDIPHTPPIFHLINSVFEPNRHELVLHYQKIKLLEKYGWNLESFVLEVEKRNILEAIQQFNENLEFPSELINRAKEFFPNVKFIEAKIELE